MQDLNMMTINQCKKHLFRFINDDTKSQNLSVLSAKPGHGKTSALAILLNELIVAKQHTPLLIVVNEKQQQESLIASMRNFSKKLPKEIFKTNICIVNADNYYLIKKKISLSSIVVITHSRLENLMIELQGNNNQIEKNSEISNLLFWKNLNTNQLEKRKIIIDEMPKIYNGEIFDLINTNWINQILNIYESIKVGNNSIKEHIVIEKTIVYSILLKSIALCLINKHNNEKTKSLRSYLSTEDREFIQPFFKILNEYKYKDQFSDLSLIKKYNWLYDLYFFDDVGTIDTDKYLKKRQILCSKQYEYERLETDILIMDGTYHYNKYFYTEKFKELPVIDLTKHNRVKIYLRNFATSSKNRSHIKSKIHDRISNDIRIVKNMLNIEDIFPLVNKIDINKYISNNTFNDKQKLYYEQSVEQLPIHLLNTRGKNSINSYNNLYLTSIPFKSANHYKLLSLSIIKKERIKFEMNDTHSDNNNGSWFIDQNVQKIFEADLLSELIQIIHRSNLRNLNIPDNKLINIFIATRNQKFLMELLKFEPYEILIDSRSLKNSNFESKVQNFCMDINRYFEDNPLKYVCYPGNVSSKLKTFLKNEYSTSKIHDNRKNSLDKIFKQNNLKIVISPNKTNRYLEKKIYKI